jgi:hypothetical protein
MTNEPRLSHMRATRRKPRNWTRALGACLLLALALAVQRPAATPTDASAAAAVHSGQGGTPD